MKTVNTPDRELRDLIASQAADFYVERRAMEATESENRKFLEWLRASPLHVAEYLAVAGLAKEIACAATRINTTPEVLVHETSIEANVVPLDDVRGHSIAEELSLLDEGSQHRHRLGRGRRVWRLSAAFAFAITAISVGGLVWTESSRELVTAVGEQRTLQLADNTIVHVDSGSAVRISFNSHRRKVELRRGQVYFEVAKDQRPFQVIAGSAVIDDRGTIFNVSREDDNTVVTLVEGAVTIRKPKIQGSSSGTQQSRQQTAVDLHPGDQATILSSGAVNTKNGVNIYQVTAWTKGEIVFDTKPVVAVAKEFNHYNRRKIVVLDPGIASLPITGVFHSRDVDSFVQFLDSLPNVRTLVDGEKLLVSSAGAAAQRKASATQGQGGQLTISGSDSR